MSATKLTKQISLGRSWTLAPLLVLVVLSGLAFTAASASAETTGPQWTVSSVSRPTNFALGSTEDSYVVLVTNTGGAPSIFCKRITENDGKFTDSECLHEVTPGAPGEYERVVGGSVTITDELPVGLEALPGATAEDELLSKSGSSGSFSKDCAIAGSGSVSCTYSGNVQPDDTLVLNIPVRATAVGSVTNVVRVSGGGAPSASMPTLTDVYSSEEEAKKATVFGVSVGGATTALSSTQAGAHPDLTTTGAFNTENAIGATVGNVKDITDDLPAGFAGDLIDTPACQAQLFLQGKCPIPTQVGVTTQVLEHEGNPKRELVPVYNLAPEPGEVAKIGFSVIEDFHYEGDIAGPRAR